MAIISAEFLIFVIIAVFLFYISPRKLRIIALLASCCYYACCFSFLNAIVLGAVIAVCCIYNRFLGTCRGVGKNKRQKQAASIAVGIVLLILAVSRLALPVIIRGMKPDTAPDWMRRLAAVTGLSFYGLQAVSYIVDRYKSDVSERKLQDPETEKPDSALNIAVYLSLFPTMTAGPIERKEHIFPQLRKIESSSVKELFDIANIQKGIILIAWGYFVKTVIADRIGIFVDHVFAEYYHCGTIVLMAAAFGYSIQLYGDFSSYSLIAAGAAKCFGIDLIDNFHTPYFSLSIREFWHRWHISLSSWLRDYIYIPLGGNRKGQFRKALNQMAVFTVSGLWHGSGLTFLVWGWLHGIMSILDGQLSRTVRKHTVKTAEYYNLTGIRIVRILCTFCLVSFSWIFFRSESLSAAIAFITRIFTQPDPWVLFDGSISTYGLDSAEWIILMAATVVFLIAELLINRSGEGRFDRWIIGQGAPFRILFMVLIVLVTIVFGIYGPGFDAKGFIYAQF